jgi:A/G-specific adenine glycosylase
MHGDLPTFRRRLLRWYDRHRRDLPWRRAPGERSDVIGPYEVLVSEAMLQQTQVATVIPYYQRFLKRFPTIEALAGADEQEVLRLWQGLGYYARARHLHRAARHIARELGGRIPCTVKDLQELPGIGRYTAGAVASIAFEQRAPILDGNVARVLCRLDLVISDPRERSVQHQLWSRAEAVLPRARVGDFNSALMELGATVCTPRSPRCLLCPVRGHCESAEAGVQEQIPPPRVRRASPVERRWTFCLRFEDRWLLEQRPATGRWAGMWQFHTAVADGRATPEGYLSAGKWVMAAVPRCLGQIEHSLTHRRYRFHVFQSELRPPVPALAAQQRWVRLDELPEYPLPRPHVRIASLLAGW